ncbi:hypothetical protein GQ457_08G027350 [Hibiscus cannabinus]
MFIFLWIFKTNIILTREEDAISLAEYGVNGRLCFYEVFADYYIRVPKSVHLILDLIVQLWSQTFASYIFTLLFHKWMLLLLILLQLRDVLIFDMLFYVFDKIDSFVKQCHAFPNAFLVGGPGDILVIELTDQVNSCFHG